MRSRPIKKQKRAQPKILAPDRARVRAKTHVGLKREINEDKYLADTSLGLFMVADGMGGHAGGDTASRMAVEIVRERIRQLHTGQGTSHLRGMDRDSILRHLDSAIRAASSDINQASKADSSLSGMGTTVTLILIYDDKAYVAHVGDSRLYRLRNGKLEQLTDDHSLVAEQIKAGFLTEDEARFSRFRNIITRSVGFESEVKVDTFSLIIQSRDTFLLCSDGLSGMVRDEIIQKTLVSTGLQQVAGRLIERANRAGGEDNITVVVVQYNRNEAPLSTQRRTKSKKRNRARKIQRVRRKSYKTVKNKN